MFKEVICLQLGLAILCGAAFAFTIVNPAKLPKVAAPGLKPSVSKASAVDTKRLDSEKLFDDIAAVPCSVLLDKGENKKAIASAYEIAKSRDKRKDVVQLLAAGIVLMTSDELRDKWKGNVLLDKALALAPKSVYVMLVHARETYKQGKIADAIKEYEKLLNVCPEDWMQPRLELATAYTMNEEGTKAIELFKEILELKKDDPRLLKRYGITMAINSDQQGGYDKFVEGSNLEYDTPNYYPEVTKMVDKNAGLLESAVADAQKTVDRRPNDIAKRILLARLLMANNRLEDAKKQLNEAKKQRETNPEIHEVMAECLYRMKQSSEALAEFNTTASLEPLSKPAAPSERKYLPTWDDLHEEDVLEKGEEETAAK